MSSINAFKTPLIWKIDDTERLGFLNLPIIHSAILSAPFVDAIDEYPLIHGWYNLMDDLEGIFYKSTPPGRRKNDASFDFLIMDRKVEMWCLKTRIGSKEVDSRDIVREVGSSHAVRIKSDDDELVITEYVASRDEVTANRLATFVRMGGDPND